MPKGLRSRDRADAAEVGEDPGVVGILGVVAGHDDQPGGAAAPGEPEDHLVPVHIRHDHVEENDGRHERVVAGDELFAAGGQAHLVAERFGDVADEPPQRFLVVTNQQALLCHGTPGRHGNRCQPARRRNEKQTLTSPDPPHRFVPAGATFRCPHILSSFRPFTPPIP